MMDSYIKDSTLGSELAVKFFLPESSLRGKSHNLKLNLTFGIYESNHFHFQ